MTKQIPLTQGKVALVDDVDYEWLSKWKWYAIKSGNTLYAVRTEGTTGKPVLMHREIAKTPSGKHTDHRDGDGLNNRRNNLRVCSHTENMRNRRFGKNASGYKGVYRWSKTKRYKAIIRVDGKNVYLGYFETSEEAARAYDAKAKELHGEFARTNF